MRGEAVVGAALRHIGLSQDIPGNSLHALVGPGDTGDLAFHMFPSLIHFLTRFLHANRYPLRSKTLWLVARRAFLGVTVAVILKHLLNDLGLKFAVGAFCHLGEI